VWHLPLKITVIPAWTTLNQGWVLDFRVRVKSQKASPKHCTICDMSFAQYMVLKKGPLPLFVHVTSKKVSYILHMLHKNFTRWKQFKFFILSGHMLLRESPFHIINCLKLVDFALFFVYKLKLLKAPFWHIFCFVLKNVWLAPELAAPEWFISFWTKQCKN